MAVREVWYFDKEKSEIWSVNEKTGGPDKFYFSGTLDECEGKIRKLEEKYPEIHFEIVPAGTVTEEDGELHFHGFYI